MVWPHYEDRSSSFLHDSAMRCSINKCCSGYHIIQRWTQHNLKSHYTTSCSWRCGMESFSITCRTCVEPVSLVPTFVHQCGTVPTSPAMWHCFNICVFSNICDSDIAHLVVPLNGCCFLRRSERGCTTYRSERRYEFSCVYHRCMRLQKHLVLAAQCAYSNNTFWY